MPTITVGVLLGERPVGGHRVVFEVSSIAGGMSKAVYTDSNECTAYEAEDGRRVMYS